jgi:hypothetical protein
MYNGPIIVKLGLGGIGSLLNKDDHYVRDLKYDVMWISNVNM